MSIFTEHIDILFIWLFRFFLYCFIAIAILLNTLLLICFEGKLYSFVIIQNKYAYLSSTLCLNRLDMISLEFWRLELMGGAVAVLLILPNVRL